MAVQMWWTGLEQLSARLETAAVRAMAPLASALYQEARLIMLESVKLCPIDTGYLRSTAYVAPPVISGIGVSVQLSYGAEYAIYVHEILDAVHPVGQAKYLEQPVRDAQATLASHISARLAGTFAL